MDDRFSWGNIFTKFQSREIDTEELESIIRSAVENEHPGDAIVEVNYTDEGIDVLLDSGVEIGIEVDWNEIILS